MNKAQTVHYFCCKRDHVPAISMLHMLTERGSVTG